MRYAKYDILSLSIYELPYAEVGEMKKIVECVPNFSEGRDTEKINKIAASFRGKKGVKLLDIQKDGDHNRSVITVVGEPGPLKEAVIAAVGRAIELIDMNSHTGQHPRMGAVDVVPFIPIKNVTMDEAIDISKEVAKAVWETYKFPVILYEASASSPERQNLANVRKGQFEGMPAKLKQPEWKPDFGERKIHPTAGVVAIGARMPLVAFNVNLDTSNIEIAHAVAKKVRHIGGGLRYCKAMGVELKERGITQVSMNMTDYTQTPLYQAFELVRIEAKRYGVNVVGSEIVGLVPMGAIVDTAAYYMGLESFSSSQVLEARIME
jgi:glutamate formiminotransferase